MSVVAPLALADRTGMHSRLAVVVLAAAVVVCSVYPASVTAATCGEKDPMSGQITRGVLALDWAQAVIGSVFKRDTGHKTLSLIFKVKGCELAQTVSPPVLEINPRKGIKELPQDGDAVSIRRVVPDGSMLDVKLDVDSAKFKPGSYGALVVLRAPYINSSRTPVSMSRSDIRWWLPAGVSALAALAGLFVFTLLQIVRKAKLAVSKPVVLVLVGVVAVGAGALLGYINYANQDVWTAGENLVATATAGFGGATGGLMAALLGRIWMEP